MMILKYRAYINGEFYYFDFKFLSYALDFNFDKLPNCTCKPEDEVNSSCVACDTMIAITPWLKEGNQPDVFIGLQDEDGTDIYENDIFRCHFFNINEVLTGVVTWQPAYAGFGIKGNYLEQEFYSNMLNANKIIGNIHQHPELLK